MKLTKELLNKLNKLDSIYDSINTEIEAYDVYIKKSIYENWVKRKQRIQLKLIEQFKENYYNKLIEKIGNQTEYISGGQYDNKYDGLAIPVIEFNELTELIKQR